MPHIRPIGALAAACLLIATTASAQVQTRMIVKESRSVAPKTMEWEVDVPPFSIEHQVRLSLECRIDWRNLAGSNPWIRVWANDNIIVAKDLLNKTNDFKVNRGLDLMWHNRGDRWRVLYSPDFKAAVERKDDGMGCAAKDEPYRFVWDITNHMKPGKNTIKISHLKLLQKPTTLVIRNVKIEVGHAIEAPKTAQVQPAPTGALPTYVAKGKQSIPMTVTFSSAATITVSSDGLTSRIATRTSLPQGKWREAESTTPSEPLRLGQPRTVSWKTGVFTFDRTVTLRDDHVAVADTVTNTSNALAGIMVEHVANVTDAPKRILLAGQKAFGDAVSVRRSAQPSACAELAAGALGLVAEDDVFRIHCETFTRPGVIGLADRSLGLEGGKSVTLEWAIYPAPGGDYWDVINAVRRNWDVNFEIPGPFVFASHQGGKPAEWYADWMRKRSLKYVCGGIAKFPDGRYAHGTGILFAPDFVKSEGDWATKMKQAAPETVPIAYFHAFCCTEPDGETKYADSKLINAKGEHLSYPYRYPLPLYLPTKNNSYGKALHGYVDTLIDKVKVSGIYWDELAYSVLKYAYQCEWDGVSVDIDRKTHAVIRKKSSVSLISQSLRVDIANTIRGKGLFLMGNGQPRTRTMMRLKIPRFIETNTYSVPPDGHLGSPIGLGNHHSEDTHAGSARHVRDILQYACVYHGHHYWRDPAPWNFTSVMYPITPVELREGMVLGKERIHTAVSGVFGWPDGAKADVYVVNAEGERVEGMAKEVTQSGKRRYEIRMPSDHFAILVRK